VQALTTEIFVCYIRCTHSSGLTSLDALSKLGHCRWLAAFIEENFPAPNSS